MMIAMLTLLLMIILLLTPLLMMILYATHYLAYDDPTAHNF